MKKKYSIGMVDPLAIFLPSEIREALNLKSGKNYQIEVKNHSIIFTDCAENNKKKLRRDWVTNMIVRSQRATLETERMNNITAIYNLDTDTIGISRPSKQDKYDEEVGFAVAYAKTIGADIPDYI